jgi:hypothetical protein
MALKQGFRLQDERIAINMGDPISFIFILAIVILISVLTK